jgi:hypothetical protein
MGEYIPQAPMNDEARRYNQNLPGMGGIFNTVNLHVYHYAGNNPVRYTDPDGREGRDSVKFFAYALGESYAKLVRNTKFVFMKTPDGRGASIPGGIIFIDPSNTFQGGYNPQYVNANSPGSDVGEIGLEIHELWHQVQYKVIPFAFSRLLYEQAKNGKNGYDPYALGDPTNPSVLNTIKKLSDINSLEGQAQFIGQWAADLYSYLQGEQVDMQRLRREAQVLFNSGVEAPGVNDILLLDYGRG